MIETQETPNAAQLAENDSPMVSGAATGYVFTEDDVDSCWQHHKAYLLEILNGEYSVESAREDLKSLVGSKYDCRT